MVGDIGCCFKEEARIFSDEPRRRSKGDTACSTDPPIGIGSPCNHGLLPGSPCHPPSWKSAIRSVTGAQSRVGPYFPRRKFGDGMVLHHPTAHVSTYLVASLGEEALTGNRC
jgi:hypothetical protein